MSAPRGSQRGGAKVAGRNLLAKSNNASRNDQGKSSTRRASTSQSPWQANSPAKRDGAGTRPQTKPGRNASAPRQSAAKQPLGTLPAWRDPFTTEKHDYDRRMSDLFQKSKVDRERERKDAIKNGFLADPDKPTALAEAITPVGTCPDMCPEFERVERIVQNMVEGCEKIAASHSDRKVPCEVMMVKRFKRSAAGTDDQIPSDIRPPPVLKRTLDYLLDEIVGGAEPLASVHKFVWDRTRAIRNDFSIQQVTKLDDLKLAIQCFECIARFHIISLHQLSHPSRDNGGFDAYQEREQLNNTLLSLMYYYDDSRSRYQSPNEAEFRAYCIIFEIEEQRPDLEDRAQSWPKQTLKHPKVQTALAIYAAAGSVTEFQGPLKPRAKFPIAQNFYGRFWSAIASRAVSYLTACVAEMYFNHVREKALDTIWRAFKGARQNKSEDMILGDVTNALGFDNEEQTQKFCEEHGFVIGEREDGEAFLDLNSVSAIRDSNASRPQLFSRTYVETKRCGRNLPAIIRGYGMARCKAEGLIDESSPFSSEDESLFVTDDEAPKKNDLEETPRQLSKEEDIQQNSSALDNPFAALKPSSQPPASLSHPATVSPSPFTSTTAMAHSNPFAKASSDFSKNPFALASGKASPSPTLTFGGTTNKVFEAPGSSESSTSTLFQLPPQTSNPFSQLLVPPNTTSLTSASSHPQGSNLPSPLPTSGSDVFRRMSADAPGMQIGHSLYNFNPIPTTRSETTARTSYSPLAATAESIPDEAFKSVGQPVSRFTLSSLPPNLNEPFKFPSAPQPNVPLSGSSLAGSKEFPQSAFSAQPQEHEEDILPSDKNGALAGSTTARSSFSTGFPFSSGIFESQDSPPSTSNKSAVSNRNTPTSNPTQSPQQSTFAQSTKSPITKEMSSAPSRSFLGDPNPPVPVPVAPRDIEKDMKKLAEQITKGDGGILEQYIESILDPIATKSLRKIERERQKARITAATNYLRAFYYGRKWRQLTWERRLARKGRKRRQNFAQSMQSLSLSTQGSAATPFEPLASSLASRRQTNGTPTSIDKARKRRSLPYASTEESDHGDLEKKQTAGRNVDGVDKQVESRGAQHQRSLTGSSPLRSAQLGRFAKPEVKLGASRSRMLSSQAYFDEALIRKARRLASGRSDTTQTDYFRLKAMGIDPDTPAVPRTLKRPRVSDTASDNPRKIPRSTPPDVAINGSSSDQMTANTSIPSAPPQTTVHGTTNRTDDEELFARAREVREAMAQSTTWLREQRETLSRSRSQSMEAGTQNGRHMNTTPSRTTLRLEKTGGHGFYNRIPRNQRWNGEGASETDLPSREETPDASSDAGPHVNGIPGVASGNSFGVLGYVFDDETSAEEAPVNVDLSKGASVEDAIEL